MHIRAQSSLIINAHEEIYEAAGSSSGIILEGICEIGDRANKR